MFVYANLLISVAEDNAKVSAESRIVFSCKRDAGVGVPKYLTGFACDLMFKWETSLVCPEIQSPCKVSDNGQLYDLSLLTKQSGAWNLTDGDGNQ